MEITRPPAPESKVRTSSDFELVYLRHQYFRKVKYNPTESEMEPFMNIVKNLTKHTFFTYFNLFKSVGMYHDDILNIGRVQLVSFLGLYHLDRDEKNKRNFITKYLIDKKREPTEEEFEQKNKANFTCFFKQRMQDLVRVCLQKVRNIKGQPSEEYVIFCGTEKPPKHVGRLIKEYDQFGYKKIDFSTFKSIRKKADVNADATMFDFNGVWYVALALDQKNLELEDLVGSDSNPYENEHNMRPDQIYAEEETKKFSNMFNQKSNYRKKSLLRSFIAKNKTKAQYKEEVSAAKKLLRTLGD